MSENRYTLSKEQAEAISEILRRGNRAEVIPVKDGIKIMCVRREEYKGHKTAKNA